MNKFTKKLYENDGFGLIEIAFVLLIIGIMATFVLKGQEMVDSARLKSVAAQIEQYRLATHTFMDRYDSLPGDYKLASKTIKADLIDGKQSGKFETAEDAKRFWQHLHASDLVNCELKDGLPTTKFGGVITVTSNITGKPGTWFVISKDPERKEGIFTPLQALRINKNAESPESGDIQAMDAINSQGKCIKSKTYNLESNEKACVILFKID